MAYTLQFSEDTFMDVVSQATTGIVMVDLTLDDDAEQNYENEVSLRNMLKRHGVVNELAVAKQVFESHQVSKFKLLICCDVMLFLFFLDICR